MAEPILVRGEAIQGGLMVFKTKPHSLITLDGMTLSQNRDGYFAIGFHRDDSTPQNLTIISPDGMRHEQMIIPKIRDYAVQAIDNLPETMVVPPPEVIARIKRDQRNVKEARAEFSPQSDALINGFDWPVHGRITGTYGTKRILNGKPRQPHYGIDIAVQTGTPIIAAADGVVVMAKNLYFTGWTIIIDHGHHLNSTYSHLDRLDISKGAFVKRGEVIGVVGSTGRSTGAHLDWRINWRNKRLDPMLAAGAQIR